MCLLPVLATAQDSPRTRVVILGTGGSSLGGQAVTALSTSTPRLRFLDNIDPASFDTLFRAVEPARTGFIVISKSGGTAETLAQFLACRRR